VVGVPQETDVLVADLQDVELPLEGTRPSPRGMMPGARTEARAFPHSPPATPGTERKPMAETEILNVVENQEWLAPVADALHSAADTVFAGDVGRKVEDFWHGTWLGHPLHPAMVTVPLGAWTAAAVLDVAEMAGCEEVAHGADLAVLAGLSGALKSAVSGFADWQYTSGKTSRLGVAHAAVNVTATTLYALSYAARVKKCRGTGRVLSMLGLATVSLGSWLGGALVFEKHVGMNHATLQPLPADWTPVIPEEHLDEGKLTCADAGGVAVVLVKRGRWISAMVNACAHMGGSLCEGTLEDDCVVCPLHGSKFRLTDGENVRGPSAFPQPVLDARTRRGMVEVRARA
jgi:nitrite reductase/ring-hydroxylating ferredoxin subunit/uncharacterized membrane protein